MPDIKELEIFAAGEWNGDTYVESDLDAMVDAFGKVGFTPPLVIGHDNASGDRAYGWVTRLYRRGRKLLADISDVPQAVYELIRERAFDTVSSEIFWDFRRNGKWFPRVLKAVALLGAATPAVSGLAPIRTVVNADLGEYHARRRAYGRGVPFNRMEAPMLDTPATRLYDRARRRLASGESKSLTEALDWLRRYDDDAVTEFAAYDSEAKRYSGDWAGARAPASATPSMPCLAEAINRPPLGAVERARARAHGQALAETLRRAVAPASGDPAKQLHDRAMQLLERGTCLGYSEAVRRAMQELPDAASVWARRRP